MNKRSIRVRLSLLLLLSLVVATVYTLGSCYRARVRREACHRSSQQKLDSLEPSAATITAEVQEIEVDQDAIDQLDGTDDDTSIQRRSRLIDGVKLKLTKVNQDRADNQRRTEQVQTELSTCLAAAK